MFNPQADVGNKSLENLEVTLLKLSHCNPGALSPNQFRFVVTSPRNHKLELYYDKADPPFSSPGWRWYLEFPNGGDLDGRLKGIDCESDSPGPGPFPGGVDQRELEAYLLADLPEFVLELFGWDVAHA